MEAFIIGAVVIVVSCALSVWGMVYVRNKAGLDHLSQYNDVAGNIFQVTGTLYAVLLGLIVVDAMSAQSDLRVTIDQEANALANVYIISRGLQPDVHDKVEQLCRDYTNAVLDEEWSDMSRAAFSKKAVIPLVGLWDTLIQSNPTDDNQRDIRSMALQEMSTVGDSRRKRILASRHGVPPIMWTTLILGGLLTVGFSYFFGLASLRGQAIMTCMVAISVSMNVYLVYLFGYPFSGAYRLVPEGFMANRKIFDSLKNGVDKLPAHPGVNDIR